MTIDRGRLSARVVSETFNCSACLDGIHAMLILIGLFDNDGVGGSRYLRGAVRCGLLEGIGDRSKLVDSFFKSSCLVFEFAII